MAQANEQKNISFEDVWGKSASANIISGKVATPLCLGFLGVCQNEKDSAHNLNRIMQALARCQLNEELLLLLEIICDIADMDYPQELIAAINDPLGADDLVRELILDFDEILTEEIAQTAEMPFFFLGKGGGEMPQAIYDYHYGMEAEQYAFFRIPKVLMTEPHFRGISTDAKLLYGLMLDRMSLSVKNGWTDDNERVYICFTLDEVCEQLCYKTDKAVRVY